jgi:O-acetyl-ADP-ribose deacetylase (regulator of RNase III)
MATIREIHGNIFRTTCQVLVNTVNCVGVMGAGIALECQYRFPGLFEYYEPFCARRELKPGVLLLYRQSKPMILCFPTKKHWKHPSRVEFIEAGLSTLVSKCREWSIESLAMPYLGCSHGGLSWEDQVRPLVYRYLEHASDLKVEVYSFDPHASDPPFNDLVERLRGLSRAVIAERIGLRMHQVDRLLDALNSGEISNMMALQQTKGLGTKSIKKIYSYLQREHTSVGSAEQLGLKFSG